MSTNGTLTWLGHAAFRIDSPGGKRIYIDPFLTGNPRCPEVEQQPERVDVIALTHGHDDHVGDTIDLWRRHSCPGAAGSQARASRRTSRTRSTRAAAPPSKA
jgi:L-ascorbate metabolism protein UlaG (beta-lactamase superfamily)